MSYSPGGPGVAPGGPAEPAFSQAGLQDVVNSWIAAITKPNVQTFAAEVPRTSQNRLIMSVGLATVIAAVLGLIGGLFTHNMVGSFVGSLIFTPVGFLVGQGIIYLIAKMVGGNGSYMEQAWVMSTFWAPILVLTNIPIIGGIIGLIAWIYSLYLTYLALQPTHRMDSTKALTVVGILFAIGLVLGLCVLFTGALAFMGLAAAGGTR
jgi:hypothetical protein